MISRNQTGGSLPVTLAFHGAVLLLWLSTFVAASLLEYAPHASLWFPPAAVTFAALLVIGLRALPVLWIACLIATMLTDRLYQQQLGISEIVASGMVFALTHTAAFGSVALVLRRLAWELSPQTTLRKVTLVLIGGALAAGFSAILGAAGLTLTGMIPAGDLLHLIAPWWIGDYAGLLTLAPALAVFLAWLAGWAGQVIPPGVRHYSTQWQVQLPGPRGWMKILALLLSSLTILTLAAVLPEKETVLFLLFVAVIVQLWIVHTESELTAMTGVISFTLSVVIATTAFGLGEQSLLLQFVIITLAANSYLGLAVPGLFRDNRRLRKLLTHDALTGAMSRAFFEDAARLGIEAAHSRGSKACLIMVDLDRLKTINDTHGHATGDAALRLLANACLENLRGGDLLGRLSGDEFAIFMPGSDRSGAARLVDRIRADLECTELDETTMPVRASFGIAELTETESANDYLSLLTRADDEMYGRKPLVQRP